MQGYLNQCAESGTSDHAHRCVRIGTSWTRKALSAVRRYAEHRDLAFFMYEKHLASTYFAAHCRAKDFGVTADVMARTSQLTAGCPRWRSASTWSVCGTSLACCNIS